MKNFFCCPSCGSGSLQYEQNIIKCNQCESTYERRRNISLLRKNQAKFYWGVEQERMEEMLKSVQKKSWENAMHDFISTLPQGQAKLIWARTFDPRRSALQSLLNIRKTDRVLEIGPGWGAIALHIAPNCQQYVAMDQILTHLEWIQESTKHFKQNNVDLVCSGNDDFLPFEENYFDKVIMNGVLEWVASNTPGNPRQVQQRFLQQISRILKPDGQLYVGIENRINWKYFLGVPEGHIRMKFGALLPRFMTRLYLKNTRQQAFREYTYTVWGYRKLLRKTGFRFNRFYATLPMYSNIRRLYPLNIFNRSYLKKILPWNRLESKDLFARFPTILFSHCLGFTGAKSERAEQSLIEKIVARVVPDLGISRPIIHDALAKISNTGKATVLLESENKKYWLSIGLNQFANTSIAQTRKAVAFLDQHLEIEKHRRYLPTILLRGQVENYSYIVEEYIEGEMAETISGSSEQFDKYNEAVFDFLIALMKTGNTVCLERPVYDRLVKTPLANLRQWFSEDEFDSVAEWFNSAKKWLDATLLGEMLPIVPRHGDLVPTNCIVNNGRLAAIIDWELFEEEGLPLSDLIIFIGNTYRPEVKQQMAAKGIDPENVAFHGYPEMFVDGRFMEWAERYLEEANIKPELLKPLLFMWWVTYLNDMLPFHRFNPLWKQLRVKDIIQRWQKVEAFHENLVEA